jgi:tetratricopeptide (TPR) repeat protein
MQKRKAVMIIAIGAACCLSLLALVSAKENAQMNIAAMTEHPLAAVTLYNQAELLRKQGRLTEAEAFYQRALTIWEKNFGSNHPSVAATLSSLAELYQQQGRLADAERLHLRALTIRELSLGNAHPGTGFSLRSMALLREQQGRLAEAEPFCQRAAAIFTVQLPEGHPDIAATQELCIRLRQLIQRK